MQTGNILIVEDDVDLNAAYKTIISSAGYDVTTAENGEVALDMLSQADDPDIIFLDLRMPVMDGIEFLKQYKPTEHPEVTIVVFSNYDSQKEVDEAYQLGAHRYILKARAAPKELIKIVKDIMAQSV